MAYTAPENMVIDLRLYYYATVLSFQMLLMQHFRTTSARFSNNVCKVFRVCQC